MLRKLFASATLLAGFSTAYSQDSTTTTVDEKKPKLNITGSIDIFYRYNLSNPPKEAETFNNLTSFTNSQNSFTFNMASIKLEHSFGKVGGVIDLGYGKRADEFSYNDTKSSLIVKQAYLYYSPWKNVKFTAGSWATHIGYELVDAYLNRNYSMSYMFSYGPFFNTGLKGEFTVGKSTFMLGISDPSDLKSADFSKKFIIGQYATSLAKDAVKVYLNYQGGNANGTSKMNQVDAVVTGALSPKFSIGYNGTVQMVKAKDADEKYGDSKNWWGSALYFNLDPKPWFGLTLRGEYFDDKQAVSGGAFGTNFFETTLSANFKVEGLTIIPEVRYDASGKKMFTKHDGTMTKNTSTILVAAIYHF